MQNVVISRSCEELHRNEQTFITHARTAIVPLLLQFAY